MMSSSLDKLKALTNRLDDRLTQKRESSFVEDNREDLSQIVEKAIDPIVDPITKEDEERSDLFDPDKTSKENVVDRAESSSDITVLVKNKESEDIRADNIVRVEELYQKLKIFEKSPDFDNIFMYKAMNLSGIGLKDDDFGIVREGKYIQIIAITYEPDSKGKKKAKNISLGYFGKGETIDPKLKNNIIEFVLRWRYEKAFQNVEHYKNLLDMIDRELKEEIVGF
jgi:hypothetical protein